MVEREARQTIKPSLDQVRLGNQAQRGFEQKVLQGEVIFSGQLSLREILQRKNKEEDIGLFDVAFNFETRDAGNSWIYIASFPPKTSVLQGERFIHVLSAAKPGGVERSQNKNGIVNDWIILKPEERRKYDIFQTLYDEHIESSYIRGHFKEFELNHFPQLWTAINSATNQEADRDLNFGFSTLVSQEKALAPYGLDFFKSDYKKFLVSYTGTLSLARFLREKGFDDINPTNGDVHRKIDRLFEGLSSAEREGLITDFHNGLSEQSKEQFAMVAWSVNDHIKSTILIDKDGNLVNDNGRLLTAFIGDLSGINKLENGHIEIKKGESYVRVDFVLDDQTGFREPKIVDRYIAPEDKGVAPLIIWQREKATGKASYYCGRIPQGLTSAFPDLFCDKHDTLMGQIVVASYSEEVRDKLPKELRLKKGGKKQPMIEAQMPVFVGLFAKAFLNRSPVILGLEDLAEKGRAN